MDIDFMVGTTPVKLTRDWFWGGMKLVSADETVWVQHPAHPGTHFSFTTTQSWLRRIAGQEVIVEKTRSILFAAFREQRFRVLVNGIEVVNRSGM
ncbi:MULTISPECIES: hypothetical protein [Stenotrophomonas]|jgi:hypothetical protein|uniref:hypothetical protein n=1 Tax=Stenotrophomonas TaxID=40323 RepID=UPI00031224AF|nr:MULTISPECIES: hypothetical protein [Stenotrophomonas]MBD3826511.1 hypothetical protein [Stenotrophomonas sp.]QIO87993.1 hypothetical protein G9274_001678 [Stenotrophomonas rhizophila]HBS63253.1 hypothetical protein [Stenotrophomonas sp.]